MRLSSLGEFGAIDKIRRLAKKPGRDVVVGIGDDAAAFRPSKGCLTLATSDMLVEGVHFDLKFTGWRDLGYKALAANLSDIAAMGGRPRYYMVSLAVSASGRVEDIEELYRGMEEAAEPEGVRAIGGDTCKANGPAAISVTVLGEALPAKLVKRNGAMPGDHIYVTGTLGDSSGGLELLKKGAARHGRGRTAGAKGYLVSRHLRPDARVKAGMMLAGEGIAASMIDVSDGLSSDLGHILDESGAGAEIYADRLPVSDALREVFGEGALAHALHGGEDYELVFTARPDAGKALARLPKRAGTTFTLIGSVTSGKGVYLVTRKGGRAPLRPGGYEHFRK